MPSLYSSSYLMISGGVCNRLKGRSSSLFTLISLMITVLVILLYPYLQPALLLLFLLLLYNLVAWASGGCVWRLCLAYPDHHQMKQLAAYAVNYY